MEAGQVDRAGEPQEQLSVLVAVVELQEQTSAAAVVEVVALQGRTSAVAVEHLEQTSAVAAAVAVVVAVVSSNKIVLMRSPESC